MSNTSNQTVNSEQNISSARPLPQKTKLEKTQSLLTVISTSIGLLGIAGSTFAFGVSTFYTGSVDVRPDFETPGLVVKVYTSEGHESVFHTKHLNLMPGDYHLEISSPNGRVVHRDTHVRFHHNNMIDVKLGPPPQDSTISTNDTGSAAGTGGASNAPNGLGAVINFGDRASSDAATGGTSTGSGTDTASNSTTGSGDASSPATKSENSTANSSAGATEAATTDETSDASNKKRWWQVWKKGDKSSAQADQN